MILKELTAILESIAPLRMAESWDNVGLLVGDPSQNVSAAMLTIDLTPAVANEATEQKCDLVIAYHPPIFDGLKRVVAPSIVYDAIRRGMAIYSPHTALDVAPKGTNDMLADVLGLANVTPLKPLAGKATQYKLVTFVPEKDLDHLSSALFAAGAGKIGQYSSCSFRTNGRGTFFGNESTNPSVGEKGKLEEVDEIRLEVVVPISAVENVIRALRASHSYEEPAFDLNVLAPSSEGLGMGRVGTLGNVPVSQLVDRIKTGLGISNLLIAGPTNRTVARAAVCAGSCGKLLDDAIAAKADLYLTGEMRHHDALKAADAGMTVICVMHSNSERAVLKRLAAELAQRAPALRVVQSQRDRDPFSVR